MPGFGSFIYELNISGNRLGAEYVNLIKHSKWFLILKHTAKVHLNLSEVSYWDQKYEMKILAGN